jgi:hypothetical protein
MPLNFESLRDQTLDTPPDKGPHRKRRQRVIGRLADLGLNDKLLAKTCDVEPSTVKRWHKGGAPAGHVARIAIDRLGPIIDYLEADLGLTDDAITSFLTREPQRTREERDADGYELYTRWTPEHEAFCNSPLITGIGSYDGLKPIEARLQLRFPERNMEMHASQVATPMTVV